MKEALLFSVDTVDLRKIELKLGALYKKAPTAMSRALNRAADSVRTEAVKAVIAKYTIKPAEIRRTFKISGASQARLRAIIKSIGNKTWLDHFEFNPKKPGGRQLIRVAVKRGELQTLLHAFVLKLKDENGKPLIFERTGKFERKSTKDELATKGRYRGLKREMIQRMMGPSVPEMVGKQQSLVEKSSHEVFTKTLAQQIKYIQGS